MPASRGGVPHRPSAPAAAEALHPALWRASQLGRPPDAVVGSGHAGLDAVLPGGGWPTRALTELLLPHPGVGELRLVAPALEAVQARQRCVLWFDPPGQPSPWALQALGIDTRLLVLVRPKVTLRARARERLPAADLLWALEQALASGQAGAVLAWLPARLGAEALRRLQLAAQAHAGPAFLLRDVEARLRPSVTPLRLVLASAGAAALRVQLLKRRGPPLARPLELALPSVLASPARAGSRSTVSASASGMPGALAALAARAARSTSGTP